MVDTKVIIIVIAVQGKVLSYLSSFFFRSKLLENIMRYFDSSTVKYHSSELYKNVGSKLLWKIAALLIDHLLKNIINAKKSDSLNNCIQSPTKSNVLINF